MGGKYPSHPSWTIELRGRQGFSEEISYLKLSSNMDKCDGAILNLLTDEMTVHLNVLGAFMIGGIRCNVNSSLAITVDNSRIHHEMKILKKRLHPSQFTRNRG